MKKKSPVNKGTPRELKQKSPATTAAGKIHPVVIYPFKQSEHYSDLEELYQLIARLDADRHAYARPITVMDRKTHYAMADNKAFLDFRRNTVARHSDILDAWCVDTCQMWNSGLGMAYERGGDNDVYWLIPGDFNYGTAVGKEVLGLLHDLPEICVELQQDICVGEISTDHNHSKQLIDTYGTFALLYNWFPSEAKEIRQYTERPRSEFFAIRHGFLQEALRQRWYAYEQTVVMLLHAVFGNRRISRFFVGNISDLPEGRESFAAAQQQVERTERVLKTLWRERNQSKADWSEQYRILEARSEQVRQTATIILRNLLD
ncbi:MAG TPA: hypothetical protein VN887_05850 [Candidatus Angelobacter sp.]|nr:hypothetical protein [Candidatus Angelobacter sp.]